MPQVRTGRRQRALGASTAPRHLRIFWRTGADVLIGVEVDRGVLATVASNVRATATPVGSLTDGRLTPRFAKSFREFLWWNRPVSKSKNPKRLLPV